jgi:uncharacterized protein (DUF4415 family)
MFPAGRPSRSDGGKPVCVPGGRPKLEAPKVEVKIRLDAKTVEHLRGSGPGWQTRIRALLGKLVATGQI